jgi:hypothetical protein
LQHAVLEHQFRHHLFELVDFRAQFGHFAAGGLALRVAH